MSVLYLHQRIYLLRSCFKCGTIKYCTDDDKVKIIITCNYGGTKCFLDQTQKNMAVTVPINQQRSREDMKPTFMNYVFFILFKIMYP